MTQVSISPNPPTVPTGDGPAALARAIGEEHRRIWAAAATAVAKSRPGLPPAAVRGLADDVAQEAVRRALAKADQYDPTRSAVSWVIGIVFKVAREAVRQKEDQRVVNQTDLAVADWDAAAALLTGGRDPSRAVADEAAIHTAMARLSDRDRQVLTLSFFDGLSAADVAERMGMPSDGAARTAKHRAAAAFKREFDRVAADSEEAR